MLIAGRVKNIIVVMASSGLELPHVMIHESHKLLGGSAESLQQQNAALHVGSHTGDLESS